MNVFKNLSCLSRFKQKKICLEKMEIVFKDADFIRHSEEVSIKLKLPHDVVKKVLEHYFLLCIKLIFLLPFSHKRISIYGFIVFDIRPLKKIN